MDAHLWIYYEGLNFHNFINLLYHKFYSSKLSLTNSFLSIIATLLLAHWLLENPKNIPLHSTFNYQVPTVYEFH